MSSRRNGRFSSGSIRLPVARYRRRSRCVAWCEVNAATSLGLLGVAVWSLFWAVDTGQFENLDEAARAYEDIEVTRDSERRISPSDASSPPGKMYFSIQSGVPWYRGNH